MLSFLKVFARGIITTLLLPVIVLILALYFVYCLGLFIFMFFKGVVGYFRGDNFNAELPEDLEAKRIVLEKEKHDAQAKEMLNIMYQNTVAQAGFNQDPQASPQRPDGIDYLKQSEEQPMEEVQSSYEDEGENR